MDRPIYLNKPIRSVEALSRALRTPEKTLREFAKNASRLYIGPMPKRKKSGDGLRYVYDTRLPLKGLLGRINTTFFDCVYFPDYLTGSLAKRSFVSNVKAHSGAHTAIVEDISKFFDNITDEAVFRIWRQFFHFDEEVAKLLTLITTKDGCVIQGAPTSSFLANLMFWDKEYLLVDELVSRGIRYTRHLDDITISSSTIWSKEDREAVIARVYGMLFSAGLRPKRSKHKILHSHEPVTIMGLNANSKHQPTLQKAERSQIRAAVFQVEKIARDSPDLTGSEEFEKLLNRAQGRVGRLKQLHAVEASRLHERLRAVRVVMQQVQQVGVISRLLTTTPPSQVLKQAPR